MAPLAVVHPTDPCQREAEGKQGNRLYGQESYTHKFAMAAWGQAARFNETNIAVRADAEIHKRGLNISVYTSAFALECF